MRSTASCCSQTCCRLIAPTTLMPCARISSTSCQRCALRLPGGLSRASSSIRQTCGRRFRIGVDIHGSDPPMRSGGITSNSRISSLQIAANPWSGSRRSPHPARASAAPAFVEHAQRFAHARRVAEKDLEPPARFVRFLRLDLAQQFVGIGTAEFFGGHLRFTSAGLSDRAPDSASARSRAARRARRDRAADVLAATRLRTASARNAARFRHARRLRQRVRRTDLRIESAARSGDRIGRNRRR